MGAGAKFLPEVRAVEQAGKLRRIGFLRPGGEEDARPAVQNDLRRGLAEVHGDGGNAAFRSF